MFIWQQKTRIAVAAWKAKSVLALLCLCCAFAYAEKMNSTIQEAIYEFEMKGETAKAIRLLEKVSTQGDREDRENAFFYLGKIKELAGNEASANFYYQQSLASTKETNKAYWLSEREAVTGNTYESLIKNKLPLRSSIEKVFKGEPSYILLRNGNIKKVLADTIVDIRAGLPEKSDVLSIDGSGIWFQASTKDSLFFKPHYSKQPTKAYPIAATTEFYARGDNAIAQSGHTLTILDKKGIVAQVNETYNGCHIEGYYSTTDHYILNCTDNALHFVSSVDGTETYTISQFDAIQKILIDGNDILLLSGNYLFCYQPKLRSAPRWKIPFSNAEEILPFNKRIAVLEASGKITLIDKNLGAIVNIVQSDAVTMHPLALGTLGLFSNEGDLITVDTLLFPLWHFNFAKPITAPPIHTENGIYLIFDDSHLVSIAPHYYGQRKLQSDLLARKASSLAKAEEWQELKPLLDTLLKLEPGNAKAWFNRALMLEATNGSEKERQKAWSEAVRLSSNTTRPNNDILNNYSKTIGAKFVNLLPISPKTMYPQFFGHKKNLFTLDPAAERLICINADNGDTRWFRNLPKMTDSPVLSNDENTLVLASGFALNIYDLDHESEPQTIQLPGKAFNIQQTPSAIYIATWNGFLLKINKSENRLAWSRKIYSSPFLIAPSESTIYAASLEGEIKYVVENSGQPLETSPKLPVNISHIVRADSSVVLATENNRLFLYSATDIGRDPAQVLMESPIVSLQATSTHEGSRILVGLADQSLLLYSSAGTPLWKFQGRNSIFGKPFISGSLAWIDQGNEVISLSLKDGSVVNRFKTPGGAGTPFIMNRTLYSASSKRLLYGFSL